MLDNRSDFVVFDRTDNSTSVRSADPPMQLNMSRNQNDHSKMGHQMLQGALPFVQTTEYPSIILSCIVVILLCFVMEASRWSRMNIEESRKINRRTNSSRDQITYLMDAILHSIQLTCSYLLMLVFMSCDVWLCAATVAGEVIAHLLCTNYLPIRVAPKKIAIIDAISNH